MKRQSGFTLIELIIVIVILGILAVTVAPQFFNFGSDARASTVRALEGSMRGASEMVYARGQIGLNDNNNVVTRGGKIVVMAGDYAAATAPGIGAALQLGTDWIEVTWPATTTTNTYALGPDGFTQDSPSLPQDGNETGSGCFAYYTWDGGTTGQPTIGSVTEGC